MIQSELLRRHSQLPADVAVQLKRAREALPIEQISRSTVTVVESGPPNLVRPAIHHPIERRSAQLARLFDLGRLPDGQKRLDCFA